MLTGPSSIIKNHKKGRKVDKNELYEFYIKRLFFINTLMKLIVLLDNTGYIITYNFGKTSNNTIYIGDDALIEEIEKIDCKKIIFNIEDEFLISKFIKYCESYIAGTEELNEFVKNGFKTPEQKRFKKVTQLGI